MTEFRAATIDWMDRVSIVACERDHATGKIAYVASPVMFTMEKYNNTIIQNGTFELDMQSAISLMNALWTAGVRPSDYKNSSAEITRLEAHIADLRRLAFKEPQQAEPPW